MPVTPEQRFTSDHPCPICGGWKQLPQGKAIRCWGFLSEDGAYAHCTRGESAGALSQNVNSDTFAHRLSGTCACGQEHRPGPQVRGANGRGEYRQPTRTTVYKLLDAAGEVVAEHVRREYDGGRKSFTWRRGGKPGLGGLPVRELPLYGLPELLAAPAGASVVVTEGEKARDSLTARGILAVATVTGATVTPSDATLRPLLRYSPLPWGDNDDDGQLHMGRIAARLVFLGVTPRMVNWPDAPPKGDAADFQGDAEALAQLLAASLPYQAPPPTDGSRNGVHPQGDGPTEFYHLTDLGNAQRLVAQHGGDLRYCHLWHSWLVWTGKRWTPDTSGGVERRAKSTVLAMYREASNLYSQAAEAKFDELKSAKLEEHAAALWSHARRSEQAPRIAAMIGLARSESGIPVAPDALDADQWALNCSSGIIDLRTGILTPHRREALLTKMAPVNFSLDARLPLWERFLSEVLPVEDTRAYVQRCIGATIGGKAINDLLLVCYGEGGTGKSTFLNAILKTLGDYGAAADLGTFTTPRDAHGPQPDLARLKGRRMVAISEVDQGGALAVLKRVSGGDVIVTRSHHQECFEFAAQFTIWIITNQRPRVPDDDSGAWRRIREIPFTVRFPKPDVSIRDTLTDPGVAGAAILTWMVQGCLAWQKDGIGEIPPQVQQATTAYREEMDPLAPFLDDCLMPVEGVFTYCAQIWASYLQWAKMQGIKHPLGRKSFGQRLAKRYKAEHREKGTAFLGVELRQVHAMTFPQIWADTSEVSGKAEVPGYFLEESHMREKPETKCQQVSAQIRNESSCEVSGKASSNCQQVSAEVSPALCARCGRGVPNGETKVYLRSGGVQHGECPPQAEPPP